MTRPATDRTPRAIEPAGLPQLDVLGPRVAFVVPPGADDEPCVIHGTIPAAGVVPMHAHPDPETFLVLDGAVEVLADPDGPEPWMAMRAGDLHHVPGGERHGFRNRQDAPVTMLVATTARLGRFFLEVGRPVGGAGEPPGPPTAGDLRRFLEAADRHGHWTASPEQNAAVGIVVPAPA
ncbi:MAG: cupin domain-containing protein [Thermoleophilia bacterium]